MATHSRPCDAASCLNASGQRFISEESYYGVLGHAIAYQQQGRAWLITDQDSGFPAHQDNFLPAAEAKALIREVAWRRVEDVQRYTVERIADIRTTPEAQEGMKAFLEKRPPEIKGR